MTAARDYTISELASEFDVTTRAIRFYEEKGLLQPRRDGQTRRYDKADRVRLKLILRGKRLGLSLQESKDIITMYEPSGNNVAQIQKLLEKIRAKRAELLRQRQDLELMIHELEDAEQRLGAELDALPRRTTETEAT